MEETLVSKRPREEFEAQMEKDENFEECCKKHKSYNHILSLLESEEEDSTEDLSPLMTTLQQEISNFASSNHNSDDTLFMSTIIQENAPDKITTSIANLEESSIITSSNFSTTHVVLKEDEEAEKERVMRHLLQASDDELGIPNTVDGLLGLGENGFNSVGGDGDGFSFLCDKLWEIEDEAANYYALLQSELFLWG